MLGTRKRDPNLKNCPYPGSTRASQWLQSCSKEDHLFLPPVFRVPLKGSLKGSIGFLKGIYRVP